MCGTAHIAVGTDASGLLVAVVVHERAVLSPTDALTEYGEDVRETKPRGLQLVVQSSRTCHERSENQGTAMETVRQRSAQIADHRRERGTLEESLARWGASAADQQACDSLTKRRRTTTIPR